MTSPTLACDGPREDSIECVPACAICGCNKTQRCVSWPRNKSLGTNGWIGHYQYFNIYVARARRLNTERIAASGHRRGLSWALPCSAAAVHRGCYIVFNPRARWSAPPESGSSAGARRPGHGDRGDQPACTDPGVCRDRCTVPRTRCTRAALLSVFNQPDTHKEPSGSLSLSLPLSPLLPISFSLSLCVSLCKLNWYYYCDGQCC